MSGDITMTAAPSVRWYCVSRDGVATLCVDEADAAENAATNDVAWPAGAPHRAVRLIDAADAERRMAAAAKALRIAAAHLRDSCNSPEMADGCDALADALEVKA